MSRIAQIRAAAAGAPASDNTDEETTETETTDDGTKPPPKSTRKDKDMAEAEQNAAVDTAKKEGHSAGFKAANDRMTAVMASEHYAGREATAAALLAKEGLSAGDITEILATTNKSETTAADPDKTKEAAEEAARKEMRDAINGGKNSEIDADAGKGGKDKTADAAGIWDRATARVFPETRK